MCAHACNSLPPTLGDGDVATLQAGPLWPICLPWETQAGWGGSGRRTTLRPPARRAPGSQAPSTSRHSFCMADRVGHCPEHVTVPCPLPLGVLLPWFSWRLLRGPPWATSAQARTSRRGVSAVPRAQDFSWVLLLARRHQGCPRSGPRVGLSVQRQERAGPAHRDRGREGRGITVAGPTHLLAWRPWAPGLQLGAPERVSAARDCLTLASLSPSGVAFWLDLAGETKS